MLQLKFNLIQKVLIQIMLMITQLITDLPTVAGKYYFMQHVYVDAAE